MQYNQTSAIACYWVTAAKEQVVDVYEVAVVIIKE